MIDDSDVLSELGLLAGLSAQHLEVLRKNSRPLSLEAGEILIEQGITTRGPLFVMTDGLLEVTRVDESGKKHTLAMLEAPTVVGEMEFLADVVCNATVTALDDVSGMILPRTQFEKMLADEQPAAFHLALAIGRLVSERLASANDLYVRAVEQAAQPHAQPRARGRVVEPAVDFPPEETQPPHAAPKTAFEFDPDLPSPADSFDIDVADLAGSEGDAGDLDLPAPVVDPAADLEHHPSKSTPVARVMPKKRAADDHPPSLAAVDAELDDLLSR